MPKLTVKYSLALACAATNGVLPSADQEALYRRLNEIGWWWDSKAQQWMNFGQMPAAAPTPKLMIRVWAASDQVERQADEVIKGLRGKFRLIAQAGPYPCRPPKQLESRVYLEFLPGDDSQGSVDEILRENDPYAVEVD